VNEPGYVTDVITDEALRLLDAYVERGRPFYIGVHYTAPHSPWTGHPADIVASYDACPFESCPQEPPHPWTGALRDHLGNRESLKGYFAAVTAMDTNIGRILDWLDGSGLKQDTLVCFFSDNGFSCGHHGFWGKGNGTDPRNMYENSIRVPAILSQPGRIPQGRAEGAMVSAYDLAPTLLDYLGLPGLPLTGNLPGRSVVPLLEGRPMEGREDVVIFDEYGPVRMIRTAEWKYVYRHAHGPHELYDLAHDPDERTNLADDPAQKDRIADLRGRMDAWFARYVIPSRDGLREDAAQAGQRRRLG
jgi:arylsulfatase A-like enzyme